MSQILKRHKKKRRRNVFEMIPLFSRSTSSHKIALPRPLSDKSQHTETYAPMHCDFHCHLFLQIMFWTSPQRPSDTFHSHCLFQTTSQTSPPHPLAFSTRSLPIPTTSCRQNTEHQDGMHHQQHCQTPPQLPLILPHKL